MNATTPRPRSETQQVVCTPEAFLTWVEERFGKISFDLAANEENRVTAAYFGPDRDDAAYQDALTAIWPDEGLLWCNPPFRMIPGFVSCANTARNAEILMLVPASVGANWWRDHVHEKCDEYMIGRLWFVGHDDPFPKDLALLHYRDNLNTGKCVRQYPRLTARERGKL